MTIICLFMQKNLNAVQQLARDAQVYVPSGQESLLLLAQTEAAVQGFAAWQMVADEAELLGLAVAANARRQGIARQLLLASEAAMPGLHSAFLDVRADNLAAQALYRACGFAENGRRRGYYRDGTDAILMHKGYP